MPVGTWVIRTAESVVLTLCPPGPLERKTSMRRSLSSISTSTCSASGITSTPGRRGVHATLRLGDGHPLDAVHAALELQQGVRRLAGLDGAPGLDGRGDGLVAAEVGLGGVEHLDAPAAGLGVAGVHPQQVAGEERGLLTALPRLDLEQRVLAVGGVAGHQQAAQPLPGDVAPLGEVVGLLREGGVVGGQLARRLDVVAQAQPLLPGRHDGGQLGVALVELLGEALVGVGLGEREASLEVGVLLAHALDGFEQRCSLCSSRLRPTRTDDKAPATRGERETGA